MHPSQSDILKALDSYAEEAAQALKPLLSAATADEYVRFLDMMYHYTSDSEGKLNYASKLSDNPEAKNFFAHMAQEERGHHLVAKADLEAMGFKVSPEKPQVVKEFDRFWYDMKSDSEFLGALYVFENIAGKVGAEVKGLVLRLDLPKTHSRWLRLHAEADLEHGEEVKKMCEAINNASSIMAAQQAKQSWLEVFREALSLQDNPTNSKIALQ